MVEWKPITGTVWVADLDQEHALWVGETLSENFHDRWEWRTLKKNVSGKHEVLQKGFQPNLRDAQEKAEDKLAYLMRNSARSRADWPGDVRLRGKGEQFKP
jgi:hypothetical protein